ncbi:hypothetical protein ANO11243_015230 [Dothideomycetidae sp. 11243]|nr:hypothetical protein ANO11243_015230 [fungal sp. No.11243]
MTYLAVLCGAISSYLKYYPPGNELLAVQVTKSIRPLIRSGVLAKLSRGPADQDNGGDPAFENKRKPALWLRVHYNTELGPQVAAGLVPWTTTPRAEFEVKNQDGQTVHTLCIQLPAPPSDLAPGSMPQKLVCHIDDPINIFPPPPPALISSHIDTDCQSVSKHDFDLAISEDCVTYSHWFPFNRIEPSATQDDNTTAENHNGSMFSLPICATRNHVRFDIPEQHDVRDTKDEFTKNAPFWESRYPLSVSDLDPEHQDVKISREYKALTDPALANLLRSEFASRNNEYERAFQKRVQRHMAILQQQRHATVALNPGYEAFHCDSESPPDDVMLSDPGHTACLRAKRQSDGIKELELRYRARVVHQYDGRIDGMLVRLPHRALEKTRKERDVELTTWVKHRLYIETQHDKTRMTITKRRVPPPNAIDFASAGLENADSGCAIIDDSFSKGAK